MYFLDGFRSHNRSQRRSELMLGVSFLHSPSSQCDTSLPWLNNEVAMKNMNLRSRLLKASAISYVITNTVRTKRFITH